MQRSHSYLFLLVLSLSLLLVFSGVSLAESYKVSFSSVPSITDIPIEIAFQHLKEQGYDFEPVYFDTDSKAATAVANGQVEVGMCLPFAAIEQGADLKIFLEGRGIEFLPVVTNEIQSWQDMDGRVMYTHSKASTTTSMARFIEKKEGIDYKNIKFLPGSEVRSVALLKGRLDATFLDLTNTNKVLTEAPDKFHVLPFGKSDASTESFVARTKFIENNPELIQALIKEVLQVYRRGVADYTYWVEKANEYNILPDLKDRGQIAELLPVSIESGVYDPNGAITPELGQNNFELYVAGGLMQGPVEELEVDEFYNFKPLNKILDELGRVEIDVQY